MVVEERGRRGWKNRHMRDNMPCREACAVKLAPDHTSKLDAVLVDPCFIQCLLARREEKRREQRREKKEEEENEVKKEARTERERERESPSPPSPCSCPARVGV